MFGISGEHLILLAIVLLIVGPRRLPEIGNTLGKAIRNFKDAISGVEEAKFRHLKENSPPQATPQAPTGAVAAATAPQPESPTPAAPSKV